MPRPPFRGVLPCSDRANDALPALRGANIAKAYVCHRRDAEGAGLSSALAPANCRQKQGWRPGVDRNGLERLPEGGRAWVTEPAVPSHCGRLGRRHGRNGSGVRHDCVPCGRRASRKPGAKRPCGMNVPSGMPQRTAVCPASFGDVASGVTGATGRRLSGMLPLGFRAFSCIMGRRMRRRLDGAGRRAP